MADDQPLRPEMPEEFLLRAESGPSQEVLDGPASRIGIELFLRFHLMIMEEVGKTGLGEWSGRSGEKSETSTFTLIWSSRYRQPSRGTH